MKTIALLFTAVVFCLPAYAQRTVQMRNLWAEPQVHVVFGKYTVSFTVRDINKALRLLADAGDYTFDTTSALDTGRVYLAELYPGKMVYTNPLQRLLQNGVGVFLLASGHAVVKNKKHNTLPAITANIEPAGEDAVVTYSTFFDPKTNDMIFCGKMPLALYGKDLGIDW
jgi:hypothetical protein